MTFLSTLLAFAVTLGILIVIHEFGHYAVARLFGVRILRFSIGFGKPILRWRGKGEDATEWTLSALPLGGYVRMLDERDAECQPIAPKDKDKTFNVKKAWQRLLIVLAGPFSNLLLAVLIYAGCFYVGTAEPEAVLEAPAKETAAYAAGVEKGDKVLAVAGRAVRTFADMRLELLSKFGETVSIDAVSSDGKEKALRLDLRGIPLEEGKDGADAFSKAGLSLDLGYPVIQSVAEGSAAQKAGLRAGDQVLEAGGVAVSSPQSLVSEIKKHAATPMKLTVRTPSGAVETVSVTPDVAQDAEGRTIGRIGASLSVKIATVHQRYGLFESLWKGAVKTYDTAAFSVKMIGKMIRGEVSIKNISGPVTIADYAGQTARIGLEAFVSFLALVSISLGVLNLLPIPMLDGGHVLYYSVEMISGKPVSENFQQAASKVGVLLLVCLTSVALFNDLMRLFT